MRLLLVSATEPEIAPLLGVMTFRGDKGPQLKSYEYKNRSVDVLITGVGMVATAAWTSRTLASGNYDAAVNAGVCGSFDRSIALGEVVRVESDFMPELGAEDGDQFISMTDLNLLGKNDFPYRDGLLYASEAAASGTLAHLKAVSGITVNKVHGNENSIAEIVRRYQPQTESMEGAAFFYACSIAGVPAVQLRAVSNYVEKRNRDAWKIGAAVKNLNAELLKYLDQ